MMNYPTPQMLEAARTAPGFHDLEATLLGLGGGRVVAFPDRHLEKVVSRGRVFERKGSKRLRLEGHYCHAHAAMLYAKHCVYGYGGKLDIVTGYALSGNVWRQHSWLWDGKRVLEPNTSPDLYYGVILDPVESVEFVHCEVIGRLPGWRDTVRQLREEEEANSSPETA